MADEPTKSPQNVHGDPVQEQKLVVETVKAKVRRLQAELGEARDRAHGTFPRNRQLFQAWEGAKKRWKAAVEELQIEKANLVRLSGTDGSDPKWRILREAWHVLSGLEEGGVDIGERGHDLIEEIEFHVPLSKLHEDMEKEASGGRSTR